MNLVFSAVAILLLGGLASLMLGRWRRIATICGAGSALAGCGAGLIVPLRVLHQGHAIGCELPWAVPLGSLTIQIDALSAWFLFPVLALSGLAAIYGSEYLLMYSNRKNLGVAWFFYNILIVGMVGVVASRNAVLFLVTWEIMSLASFFLVTFEHEKPEVRRAGWMYLVVTHIGTAFLLLMFVTLGTTAGSFDFADFAKAAGPISQSANLLFVLAVIGFGTKAGFMPLHVWLPETYRVAPSYISAVMSGAMSKLGIYGLLRIIPYLDTPPVWWGWALVAIGAGSGTLGILFALSQHNLKRLLAYSSVENIGLITMSLGLALLGQAYGSTMMTVLGITGALLHVINHAAFKGLLFLGAGTIFYATGTLEIDRLGGLMKKLPITGLTFLVGIMAICGIVPLNGFVSEFLIYLAALHGTAMRTTAGAAASVAVIATLALIGGLAIATFAKAFGIAFLGEPRSQHAMHVQPIGIAMLFPMVALMCTCGALSLFGPFLVGSMARVVRIVTSLPAESTLNTLTIARTDLTMITIVALALILLALLLVLLRRYLLHRRTVALTNTWDCGYMHPSSRIQYTGSSFVQPLTHLFRSFVRTHVDVDAPKGLFPQRASLTTSTPDAFKEHLYRPAFLGSGWFITKLHWFQHGRVQLYVLYVAITLVALLVWKMG